MLAEWNDLAYQAPNEIRQWLTFVVAAALDATWNLTPCNLTSCFLFDRRSSLGIWKTVFRRSCCSTLPSYLTVRSGVWSAVWGRNQLGFCLIMLARKATQTPTHVKRTGLLPSMHSGNCSANDAVSGFASENCWGRRNPWTKTLATYWPSSREPSWETFTAHCNDVSLLTAGIFPTGQKSQARRRKPQWSKPSSRLPAN